MKKIIKVFILLALIVLLYEAWELAGLLTNYYLTKDKDVLIESPVFINNYFPEEYLNITKIYFVKSECLKVKKEFCTMGEYTPFDKIYIATKNSRHKVIFNIYHEYGHHILRYYLEQEDKLKWAYYYKINGGITEYGETAFDEDFSEYYAYVQTKDLFIINKINKRDLNREKILNRLLKDNPEFDLRNTTFK